MVPGGVVEHRGWGPGLVEHTVGSSGHRPRWVVVPGTGRSVDREPLVAAVLRWVGGSVRVGVVGCLRTAQWTRASLK